MPTSSTHPSRMVALSWSLATRFQISKPICALWGKRHFAVGHRLPGNDRLQALSRPPAPTAWCERGEGEDASCRNNLSHGIIQEDVQELLWQKFFSDPTQWWDNRRSKEGQPHFRHKESKDALWLNHRYKPAWVDSQLALWGTQVGARVRTPPPSCVSTSVQGPSGMLAGHDLEVARCRKLCEDGHVTEAVNALDLLVHRGCHIDNNLFYCVLKRCIAQKNLVLGTRVHALAVESGYEGNTFVATHLIGLYDSHGRLEEALRVFSKVSTPDSHLWASILFACARHGKPTQAIALYQQMRSSTVKLDNRVFVAALKACASAGDLAAGKDVHAHILASTKKPDFFVQNSLIRMYAKCSSLDDARRVFDSLLHKNVVTWNTMIAGYAQQGMGQAALSLYSAMQQEGLAHPSSVTFVSVLQACASLGALPLGKQVHVQIAERGLQADLNVSNSLVNMYAKCGSLEDAERVFRRLSQKDVVTWNCVIAGYAQQGMGLEALRLYDRMRQEGITCPNFLTFVSVLQACASVPDLARGKRVHAQIKERGWEAEVVVGTSLLNMYGKCGSLADAQRVFDTLTHKNVGTWNAMITGYVQQGMYQEALDVYIEMQAEGITQPDPVTFVGLLQACAGVGAAALVRGKQLHADVEQLRLQSDVIVGASLVNMYAKCGSLLDAQRVFDRLSDKDVVTWNTMLAGYTQKGMGQEALSLYQTMQEEEVTQPDAGTLVCLLQACATVGIAGVDQGKQFHAHIEERGLQDDVVVGTSLVNMYSKCGSLEDARRVFDGLLQKNVVTWTAMISGYAQHGLCREAFSLYSSMQQQGVTPPNSVTLVCLLQACASVGTAGLPQGKRIHAQITELGLQAEVVVGNSLVNMYAKCGSVEDAEKVFDTLSQKDVVTWTTMIAGYVQQDLCQEALSTYCEMQQECITSPNHVTFLCLLQACASVAALPLGKQLHAQIEEQGLQADAVVGPSLVNMYAKCGSLEDAQQVFDSLPEPGIAAWGALIAGYARQGDSQIVFDLVDRMIQDDIHPDGITLLSVLTVCSHVGLVDKGRQYFQAMGTYYGIAPTVEHYTCMMDLLGRAGHLDEALQMVKTLPFQPSAAMWLTLLGSCRNWTNVEVGRQAFQYAVSLDEKNAAAYLLMSNIYAGAEMWQEANETEAKRVKCGAWKLPGQCWWADAGGVVHAFVADAGSTRAML